MTPLTFAALDSGFAPTAGEPTVMASPNQLGSVVVQGGRVYVPSISVSPAPPVKFNSNVQPIVYVGDLATREEKRDNVGSANYARVVKDAAGTDPVLFLADLVDMAFIGDSNIAYALSRGAEVVQRVVYDPAQGIQVGSQFNLQNRPEDGSCGQQRRLQVSYGYYHLPQRTQGLCQLLAIALTRCRRPVDPGPVYGRHIGSGAEWYRGRRSGARQALLLHRAWTLVG